ncbi:MAG TPA: molybdopterin-dependent oxidoreductase [Ktedonobacterales bacterium]|nr:molybdopterin-dependent oxidoreductase [Ktedonobacterales bacterium]
MRHPDKDPALVVRETQPFNAGTPLDRLCQSFVTPCELFYVRNHGDVPEISADGYTLTITGMVRTPLRLTPTELRRRFTHRTLAATLECAGNRRDELARLAPIPRELLWGADAIGNALWGGVALADVLSAAGIEPQAKHVAFTGLDQIAKQGRRFGFGASIPLDKALSPEVLLAYEMNGAPLASIHGYPLRVVVPGYIGARSVKWLAEVRAQAEPSANYYQAHAYKLFPPEVTAETVDWSQGTMLGQQPISAVICIPAEGARVPGERVIVRGYAYAGGRGVARVEVSCDGQAPWTEATLKPEQGPWTWRLWEAALSLHPETRQIVARAWDGDGNGQPEDLAATWNFKGYLNTAWHRITIRRE